MPEVICDTLPLQYLYQIGHLNLLNQLAEQVIVPPAVIRELEAGRKRGVALPVRISPHTFQAVLKLANE